MSEMLQAEEQHKIKVIEELTCKLANSVGNALGRANNINRFFFGVPEDKAKSESEEPQLTGWFESHMSVLRRIEDRVQDVYNALGNIHEVVDKK
jgi:hypothetical protein